MQSAVQMKGWKKNEKQNAHTLSVWCTEWSSKVEKLDYKYIEMNISVYVWKKMETGLQVDEELWEIMVGQTLVR